MNDIKRKVPIQQRFQKVGKPGEGILFYADLMGFKARIKEEDHDSLKHDLEDLVAKLKKGLSQFLPAPDGPSSFKTQLILFSDTIIFFANACNDDAFNKVSKAAIRIFHICLQNGFALKGVITKGRLYCNDAHDLMFGRALVDAYEMHDSIKYYGIVVHHSAERFAKRNSSNNPYKTSKLPFAEGEIEHWHLCWNLMDKSFTPNDITNTAYKWLDYVAEHVSGQPRLYIERTKKVLEEDRNHYQKH